VDDGIERHLDLSIDCLANEVPVWIVVAGRGGAGVSVDGDDCARSNAAQCADDEGSRALLLDADRARHGVGVKARIWAFTASAVQNGRSG